MKPAPVFETEAKLCSAWIEWATRDGYRCYPETAGFDILAVDPAGWQIGVEAKLRMNVKVISQALPRYSAETGPDFRAVLVPNMDSELRELCAFVGLETYYCITRFDVGRYGLRHEFARDRMHDGGMFDWNPKRRCELPEYMPDVPAGVPSPVQLTPWKVAALKVLARLEISGWITRKEIAIFGVDPRRWTSGAGWLLPLDGDPKRGGRYRRGEKCPHFDHQHPQVYAEIRAELIAAGEPTLQRQLEVATA
jgi:hypothetical protein